MNKIVDGDFAPPTAVRSDYPAALEAVVMRALQCEPANRYPTAAELQRAIEEVATAIGERPSTLVLAEHMHMLFGDPAYPSTSLESEPIEIATTQVVDTNDAVPAPRRRAPWIAAAVATAGLLGGAAWVVHASEQMQVESSTEPTRDVTPAPKPAVASTPAPPPDAGPPPEPVPRDDADPQPASAAPDTSTPTPTRAPTSKKRKPKRKKPKATEKTDRNAFFPEGS